MGSGDGDGGRPPGPDDRKWRIGLWSHSLLAGMAFGTVSSLGGAAALAGGSAVGALAVCIGVPLALWCGWYRSRTHVCLGRTGLTIHGVRRCVVEVSCADLTVSIPGRSLWAAADPVRIGGAGGQLHSSPLLVRSPGSERKLRAFAEAVSARGGEVHWW